MIEYDGKNMCLTDWELEYGLPAGVLHHRIRLGWTIEDALKTSVGTERGGQND
jgi:hypothetical protein